MYEYQITSVGDLHHTAMLARQLLQARSVWFRGQRAADWKLCPAVHRGYERWQENSMCQEFRLRAPARSGSCPAYDDVAGWLTLMRQTGLPTRLLEWTESILMAAFFAVSYEPGSDDPQTGPAVIWALEPTKLNQASIQRSAILLLPRLAREQVVLSAFGPEYTSDEILAAFSSEADPRTMLQQSAFTIHGAPTPIEELPNCEQFLLKLMIPADHKHALSRSLDVLGVRTAAVFPDLSHLARGLREAYSRPRRAPEAGA